MIRIIQSLTSPVQTVENPEPVEMVQIPNGAVSISTHDGIYLDYIIEDGQAIPADAIYVGRMEEDGTVTDLVGNSDTFPHSFLGWDKKEEVTPVEPDGTVTDLVSNADTFPHNFLGWDKKKEVTPVEPV